MEENKESRSGIDPECSSGSFHHIYKSLSHHYHLEKEKGDLACGPKKHDYTGCWNSSITTRPTDLNLELSQNSWAFVLIYLCI